MKTIIVYSALHTGTWFTCDILTGATKEYCDYRADSWINNGCLIKGEKNTIIEDALYYGKKQEIEGLLSLQRSRGLHISNCIDSLILQAHNRSRSPFFTHIQEYKPEVPVVIPFRDPLLSINTRAWRECGSMATLQEEHIENRKYRVRDQLASIIRLLCITKEHAYKFAIDIPRTEEQKIEIFNDVIDFAGLTPDPIAINRQAKEWRPINTTINLSDSEKKRRNIEEDEFVSTKNAIINGDIEFIEKYMDIELDLTRKILINFKPDLEELGYSNLHWW